MVNPCSEYDDVKLIWGQTSVGTGERYESGPRCGPECCQRHDGARSSLEPSWFRFLCHVGQGKLTM